MCVGTVPLKISDRNSPHVCVASGNREENRAQREVIWKINLEDKHPGSDDQLELPLLQPNVTDLSTGRREQRTDNQPLILLKYDV